MAATSIGVDRPAERDLRLLGHVVEDRFRANLVEPRVDGLGRVEMAHHRVLAIAGQPRPLLLLHAEVAPAVTARMPRITTHGEHMFAGPSDGRRAPQANARGTSDCSPLSVWLVAPRISTSTSAPGEAVPLKFTTLLCRERPR